MSHSADPQAPNRPGVKHGGWWKVPVKSFAFAPKPRLLGQANQTCCNQNDIDALADSHRLLVANARNYRRASWRFSNASRG
jgi:hypothetical protein